MPGPIVLTNAKVLVNSVDLSDHVRQVRINYKGDVVDNTAMAPGSTPGTRSRLGSLLDWDIQIDFIHDEAAGKVEVTIFPLIGTTTVVDVQPVNAARSATNPSYTGTALVESMEPVAGTIGQLAMDIVRFLAAGILSRATA